MANKISKKKLWIIIAAVVVVAAIIVAAVIKGKKDEGVKVATDSPCRRTTNCLVKK